ncbi:stage II sporulation protein P [Alkaliphilus serpentinus]|nr:stage II sporulation protein P [Alkaliphilus serpentinus]
MNKKIKRIRLIQNIIIIVLIIGITALTLNTVLSKNIIENQLAKLNPNKTEEISPIFYKSIQQIFPATGFNQSVKNSLQLKKTYKSLIGGLFFFDFKNPLTFIKNQFPAVALVTGIEYKEVEKEAFNPKDIVENNETKEVDNPSNKENPINDDDKGEDIDGIYLPEDDSIIDSIEGDVEISGVEIPQKLSFQEDKPQILIYHTHGTESYKPASEGNYHTQRKEYSVIEIGKIMAEEFEKRGYEVIHDTTYHDYPSYNGSYLRSESTVMDILKKNPSIKVVLDIHRDGYDKIDTNPNRNTITANNRYTHNDKTSSKFQLVIGSATPNRQKVETFAKYIKAYSDIKYPDFSKPILVKPYGSFNQFLADHYALVEVGSNANTIEEAKLSAIYIVDIFATALDDLKE